MRTISCIIPAYNEEGAVEVFYAAISAAVAGLKNEYVCEFIFIDDGSSDQTGDRIEALIAKDPRVRLIQFSRNFGKESATSAGLAHATGDAVVMMDIDLQHPPVLIGEFLQHWEAGSDVVIGVRRTTEGGVVARLVSSVYYWLMHMIADMRMVPRATDFRLLDRKVVDAFNRLQERDRMTRGLIDWLGFRREYVLFDSPARTNGARRYGLGKRFHLAIASIVAHSLLPLRLAGYLGIVITGFAGLLGLFIFVEQYMFADPWGLHFSGPAILAVILLFLVGIILMCLGLIALYIAAIKVEIAGRPLYVIRKDARREME